MSKAITYDRATDTLTINLRESEGELTPYRAGTFTVILGDRIDDVVAIRIGKASKFLARAAAEGLPLPTEEGREEQYPAGEWHNADSSMISAYRYLEDEQILEVMFNRTGLYRYFDVPRDTFEGLHAADSKGRYMRASVINMYHYVKGR